MTVLESMTYNKRLLSYVGKFIEKQESSTSPNTECNGKSDGTVFQTLFPCAVESELSVNSVRAWLKVVTHCHFHHVHNLHSVVTNHCNMQCARSLTYSLTHSPTHSLTHSLTHSHTHSLTHTLTHTHSLTHSSSLTTQYIHSLTLTSSVYKRPSALTTKGTHSLYTQYSLSESHRLSTLMAQLRTQLNTSLWHCWLIHSQGKQVWLQNTVHSYTLLTHSWIFSHWFTSQWFLQILHWTVTTVTRRPWHLLSTRDQVFCGWSTKGLTVCTLVVVTQCECDFTHRISTVTLCCHQCVSE